MREALADYQRSVDDLLAGTTGFREAAADFQSAAAGLQSSNAKLNAIVGAYSDALHQHLIPGHPGSLVLDEDGRTVAAGALNGVDTPFYRVLRAC